MRGDNGIFAWMTKESCGAYHELIGTVRKIDEYARFIETDGGDVIPLDDVYSIDGTDVCRFFGRADILVKNEL